MRETKFRGRSIGAFDKGEWRYGYLMQMHQPHRLFIGKWHHIGGEATIKDELFSSYEEVDPETVGQFTGLKDKNGVEVYEGDIVSTSVSSEWDSEVPRTENAVIEWDGDRYWAKSQMTTDWHGLSDFHWKVIGNIHE